MDVVLVTGSAGLIGRRLVQRLAERYTVVGFDHEGHSRHPPPEAECVCIDITDLPKLRTAIKRIDFAYGKRIASVVHLAAYYDFTGEPSPKYDAITVGGTRNLLEALQGYDIDQIVFSSTMLVHQPSRGPGHRINETAPLQPKWPYPESKVETERLLRDVRGSVALCTLRIAGVYTDRCQSVPLAHQMQRIYEDDPLSHLFPGDLTHGQSFVHLDDTVDAIASAVDKRHDIPPERDYLIGESETLSYEGLQDLFAERLHGKPWETRTIPKPLAKTGAWLQEAAPGRDPFIRPFMIDVADDHYELDTTRAKSELGWQPRRRLRDAIPKMTGALLDDPERFYRENKLQGKPPHRPAPEKAPPKMEEHAS